MYVKTYLNFYSCVISEIIFVKPVFQFATKVKVRKIVKLFYNNYRTIRKLLF